MRQLQNLLSRWIEVLLPVVAVVAALAVGAVILVLLDTNPMDAYYAMFNGAFGSKNGLADTLVGAIGVAQEKGVPWIGVQADQSPVAPEIVAATAIYDWKKTLVEIIQKHQAGTLGGEVLQLTYANGGIRTIYSDTLPPEAVEAAQAAEAGLIDGSITIVAESR